MKCFDVIRLLFLMKILFDLTLHEETADNELELWKKSCESSQL